MRERGSRGETETETGTKTETETKRERQRERERERERKRQTETETEREQGGRREGGREGEKECVCIAGGAMDKTTRVMISYRQEVCLGLGLEGSKLGIRHRPVPKEEHRRHCRRLCLQRARFRADVFACGVFRGNACEARGGVAPDFVSRHSLPARVCV